MSVFSNTDEWKENMDRLTEDVDNAVDVAEFLKKSEMGIIEEKEKLNNAMAATDMISALNSAGESSYPQFGCLVCKPSKAGNDRN